MAIATSTAIALGLAAAASAATYANTQRTAKKQDNAMAQGIRQRDKRQSEADLKVNELIDKTAGATSADEKAGSLEQYMKVLRGTKGAATGGLNQVGALSNAAKESDAEASLGISDYGSKIAGLMSRIDAPAMSRLNQGIEQARYGSEIDRIRRFSGGDDFLAQLKLQGIRRNPWVDAAAAGMQGYAGATGGGAGWGG